MMINRRFKTDVNRHGEPICGWSDLPVSGCAHCHGNAHPRPADRTETPDHACQGKAKEETA